MAQNRARMVSARRMRVVLLAGMLMLAAFVVSTVTPTDAAWVDGENTVSTFTASEVPEPAASACTTRTGARGINQVTLNWRVPAGVTGYSSGTVEFGQRSAGGQYAVVPITSVSTVTTTGTPSAYATQIAGTALHGTPGTSKVLGLRFTGPGAWTSDWVDACTFAAVRPRILASQITATASSEEPGGGATYGRAAYVTDDNASTFWHSRYLSLPVATYPHVITLDLGRVQSIDGLGYLARQPTPNWPMRDFTLEGSTNGTTYTRLYSGMFANSANWQDANFTQTTARYVRLTVTTGYNGPTYAEVAELIVWGTATP